MRFICPSQFVIKMKRQVMQDLSSHVVLLNSAPASSRSPVSHAHISTANQQPMQRTKPRPTLFNNLFTRILVIEEQKRSAATYVTLQF